MHFLNRKLSGIGCKAQGQNKICEKSYSLHRLEEILISTAHSPTRWKATAPSNYMVLFFLINSITPSCEGQPSTSSFPFVSKMFLFFSSKKWPLPICRTPQICSETFWNIAKNARGLEVAAWNFTRQHTTPLPTNSLWDATPKDMKMNNPLPHWLFAQAPNLYIFSIYTLSPLCIHFIYIF